MAGDKFIESSYEKALIALFQELGYTYECGYDVERDYREPFYREVLEASLKRLNKGVSADILAEGLKMVTNLNEGTLIQDNRRFTEMLQNGFAVPYLENGENRTATLRLVDFEQPLANDFRIVNQWSVEELGKIRCDMVVMINGLPLVVVELKTASDENVTIEDAYLQIRNYMKKCPSLFGYNAFCVISDLAQSKAGTITSKFERFMEWKSEDGNYETKLIADYATFFKGMFMRERLIDILKNYICFDLNDGAQSKILTAYHQYFAVEKAVARAHQAVEGDGKIGVFWHTQGSGKSFSMIFFAHQLIQEFAECTLVVVTDRKDLDNQLYGQFCRCQDFLRQVPVNAESREHLQQLLRDRKAGGIIFTTIQKFEEGDGALSNRKNIIVMTDEAHRSQYGDEHWDVKSNKMKKGFSLKMREALPHASFIGFTGTPISDRDRDTQEVFGDYIDIYDMSQAVDDGATRPVYYENRVVNLSLDEETLAKLDAEFDTLEAEGATEAQLRKAKQELSRLEVLLGDDDTIDSLARDIVKHYEENRAQELTGKAMIVAYSRQIAIKLYKKMLQLRPEWTEKVKVVMSSSNKDPEEWADIIGNEKYKEELARKFKDDKSEMKIAIVRDMWLTGFDVPSLATMYVYKPMRGHNLMQAIARVNRVFPEKEGGLIVDYIGIAQALRSAMNAYTNRDRNRFGDPNIARTAMVTWQEEVEICRDKLHNFSYGDFFSGTDAVKADIIKMAVNFLADPKKIDTDRPEFVEHSRRLHNATTLCRSLLTNEQKLEVALFDTVRVLLAKLDGGRAKVTKAEINDRIGALLRQSVKSEGIINLFADHETDFSLFDEAFMAEIRNMKEKNLAVELLTKLLKEKLRSHSVNVVQSEKFSDMLSMALSNYLKGLLTNQEVIEELLKMAQQIKAEEQEGNELGLNDEEKAFYDALSKPEGVKSAFSDEEFLAMTKELTEVLHRNRTIDWNHKESARAKMRVMIKRLLKKYKYPPKGAEEALETVMRQCDHWADDDTNFSQPKPVMYDDGNEGLFSIAPQSKMAADHPTPYQSKE